MNAAEGPPAPLHSDRATPPHSDRSAATEDHSGATEDRAPLDPGALPVLCPFLATEEGTWRSARAVREHRCMAVTPPVPLAPEKQRRLCLVDAHVGCATYGAAMAARSVSPARYAGQMRPVARMTPVILDQGRFDIRIPSLQNDRASQVVLVGLLGVAFAAVLLARPADPAGAGPLSGDSTPRPSGSVASTAPAPTGTRRPTSTPTAEPQSSSGPAAESTAPTDPPASAPAATASPRASAQPTLSGETYRVSSGDTLIAIAARFGTTPQVLAELNDIADPSRLKVGQILILP